jgi:tRNA-specific 2-thiouridylase
LLDYDNIAKDQEISLLLSGGVDSSVALGLLKNAGYKVRAYYLKIWLEDELTHLGQCPWQEDLAFAKEVCDKYEVSLEVIPLQREYEQKVIQYTISELKAGGTPSPDLMCNSLIKFGAFAEKSKNYWIATGHYARAVHQIEDGSVVSSSLKKAKDPVKDQTYFLSQLSSQQLSRLIFPLGHLEKHEVRTYAQDWNLPNAKRKDSQGICFLGKIPYREFVKHHLGEKVGPIIHRETEQTVGEHNGSWFHTIGQRKGLGLSGGPWFVVAKDFDKNIVFVSQEEDATGNKQVLVKNFNWLERPAANTDELEAKLRHGSQTYRCNVEPIQEEGGENLKVLLDEADRGAAPGQFCVLYQGKNCLGSGRIL